jgi:hypothetical protein
MEEEVARNPFLQTVCGAYMSHSVFYKRLLTAALAFGHKVPYKLNESPVGKGFSPKMIPKTCPRCQGDGLEPGSDKNCSQCGGRTFIKVKPT